MTDKPNNNLLIPPSPTSLTPMPTQSLKINTGSATGNPRNKCALKPGHSLMDWIRLGNSGADLSGTKGRIIPVTLEELAKHNTRDNAWMAIRGVVYNVTRYMDFHPGGVEELMRGVGKDATKLFNEVHAWVNYQQLLNKCLIGPLKNAPRTVEDNATKRSLLLPRPPIPSQDFVPRLDWIQNRNNVTIFFYTKQFCNPGCLIRNLSQSNDLNSIEIWIMVDIHLYQYAFEFWGKLVWPPKDIKIFSESGKIELCFKKPEENTELWPELGKHLMKKQLKNSIEEDFYMDFKVVQREQYNHDSFTLALKNDNIICKLPIGYHISIEGLVNSTKISKCYTPIPSKYLKQHDGQIISEDNQNLGFLIKKYENANSFTTYLKSVPPETLLKLSVPKGNFKLDSLAGHRTFCFLAAGSGITPSLSIIEHLLKRNTNRIELLKLFYFNKTCDDIWCQEILSITAKQDERFEFTPVLSKPDDSWMGSKGHISVELLAPLVDKSNSNKITHFSVCGPSGFNQKVEEILHKLEFPKTNIFIF
ncbi:cytochrome b5 reductase 4 [Haematobia irritans]|uniref:cytochrome b5 reductase 4 n=1 Tax=Haematobia irritans TaxID=7368 RepID=UPI003F4F8752